jgi:2-polyprenyl-6-methoxyphenol hydroxylase-like FAD-dependent oxidoreductase
MDDIIVVGGRCAGAPTAMLLARAGFKVRIIERSSRLGDTLSGHIVRTAGAARLQTWGLLDSVLATGCPPMTESTVWLDGEPVTTPDGQQADHVMSPKVSSVAPRRSVLDPLLLEAARQAGAVVETGNSVRGLLTNGNDTRITGVSTDRGDYQARLVIGADGRNSRVAQLVGAGKYIDSTPATYAYYTYWRGDALARTHFFFDEGSLIGMVPTNDDLALVFFQAPHTGFDAARRNPMENYLAVLRSQPAAMKILDQAEPAEALRGTGDLPTFFRVSAGPGWALAGDAGHHKDPLIARGITDAFRDAELIADAVISGWDSELDQAMAAYPAKRDACARPLSSANDAITASLGSVPTATLALAMSTADQLEDALDPAKF